MKFSLKILSMLMIVIFMSACNNDDDNRPSNIMTLVDKTTGVIYAVDTANGDLTALTNSITFEGDALLGIRDIVYNSSDSKIYVTLDTNHDGKIYSVDTTTLEATLINNNDDDSWYAIAELIISNGKLVGVGYMDEPSSFAGLTEMNFDGTEIQSGVYEFKENGESLDLYGGMGLEFGDNTSELLISIVNDDNNETVIMKSDLSGAISEMITIIPANFPVEFSDSFAIKSLEKDSKGNLFALVYDYDSNKQYFAKVDLSSATVTNIKELTSNKLQSLTKIPENIF